MVKNPPANARDIRDQVQALDQEDRLEEEITFMIQVRPLLIQVKRDQASNLLRSEKHPAQLADSNSV